MICQQGGARRDSNPSQRLPKPLVWTKLTHGPDDPDDGGWTDMGVGRVRFICWFGIP